MDAFHGLRPHTPRERLHTWLHREPVSKIPHWDTLRPPDLPTIDVETEWTRLLGYIHNLADAGALDEAHGDLLDRDLTRRFEAFQASLDAAQTRRLQIFALPQLQAHQHLTVLSGKVGRLRKAFKMHSERVDHAWFELTGVEPAEMTAELPVQARPLPTIVTAPVPEPSADDAVLEPTVAEIGVLHAVPEPERGQG